MWHKKISLKISLLFLTFVMFTQVSHAKPVESLPKVTVVLAGGGAKGFAHLAVLRRLERDGVQISKIIGTSMGAVIGGLYASGMSTQDIERVIGSLDPSKTALDLIDRLELSNSDRTYQKQYPVDIHFGIKNGELTLARGFSDGQRFLSLLQELTSHVSSQADFDQLKIPFRAIATRYSDGELTVFKTGSLALAIRASMAAPGVFAPVEIGDQTYIDGGLVSNLPIDVAIEEGAEIIVASYLKSTEDTLGKGSNDSAFRITDRMLDILIKQNERRSLAKLRPTDILVSTDLKQIKFADFNKAAEIVATGELAVKYKDAEFQRLALLFGNTQKADERQEKHPDKGEIIISSVKVKGTEVVNAQAIESRLNSIVNSAYSPSQVSQIFDRMYTSGYYERISYDLNPLADGSYEMVVSLNEKTYGPNYLKTSFGFQTERNGNNLFAMGIGYRRPWLNDTGLEAKLDASLGSDTELTGKLYQPITDSFGLEAIASHKKTLRPFYNPYLDRPEKLSYKSMVSDELSFGMVYDIYDTSQVKWSILDSKRSLSYDTALSVVNNNGDDVVFLDFQTQYKASRLEFLLDKLDAPTFSSDGYYLNLTAEHGIGGSNYQSLRSHLKWATSYAHHTLNIGANLGQDRVGKDCTSCSNPNLLLLGGFQSMGAFKFGQLSGENLAHAHATYAYRLSDGGILRQKTYIGYVTEVGDAWTSPYSFKPKKSHTIFTGVDSKLGDIYIGFAQGSSKNKNVFFQLGRRFNY